MDVSVVSSMKQNGAVTERLYFSAERTAGGVTRVFARLTVPAVQNPPVVIVMNDLTQAVDDFDATDIAAAGYACLAVDYAGARDDKERYTIYPKEMRFANYFANEDALSMTPQNPKMSCWYVWTTVLLRAITFAECDGRLGKEIALLGIGAGGSQVFKCAALENVKCGITIFSTHVKAKADSNEDINFKACLDNLSYAPLCRFPVLSEVCSNDPEGFFDRMSEIYAGAPGNYYLSVAERSSRRLKDRQKDNVRLWLNQHLKMGLPLFVTPPQITARESEKSLYYEIKADVKLQLNKVELFVAYSDTPAAYRNWRRVKTQMAGEGDYLAKVPVYDASAPVHAFANVTYANGFTFSTPLLSKIPASMGVENAAFVKSRLVYDSDSGADDWVSAAGSGGDDVAMGQGAFSIEGVGTDFGELGTYKIGDVQFCAEEDSALQLIAFSETEQEIEFAVRTNADAEYSCRRKIEKSGNWSKFTLSPEDFKSSEGALTSFALAAYFCLRAPSRVLINTMLWV